MKKLFGLFLILLMVPVLVWAANCKNPIGKTFEGHGWTLSFEETWAPDDGIIRIVAGTEEVAVPYTWDASACRASLQTDAEKQYYLDMSEGWLDLTTDMRFKWVPRTTVED